MLCFEFMKWSWSSKQDSDCKSYEKKIANELKKRLKEHNAY